MILHPSQPLYITLQEFSIDECESWIYFIKIAGNEENIRLLKTQLESIDWKVYDGLSRFDIDTENPVSEETAKQMVKVELNVYLNRKFDGVLRRIDFGFKATDSNKKKMKRVFYKIGMGMIDRFIDKEDVDSSDDTDNNEEMVDDDGHAGSDGTVSSTDESSSEQEDDSDSEEEEEEEEEDGDVTASMPGMLNVRSTSSSLKK